MDASQFAQGGDTIFTGQTGGSKMKHTVVGVDVAKRVFQEH